ncbi:MAG: plasmid pRiA4b ORF-3 family protein [Monoglobales bacterium]
MAEVYKFKVKLCELEEKIWRDIEISSLSTVSKMAYTVLAAFGANGSHLFCVRRADETYEFMYDDFGDVDEDVIDPSTVKLSKLKLTVGDKITIEYDYGAGWRFDMELISVTEMRRGTGTHYPYITAGEGYGIIEDSFPGVLEDYIEQTDKTGALPMVYSSYEDKEKEWDYRRFDLKLTNMLLKYDIDSIKEAYEGEYED